jgi:recombination protein RecR
VDLIAKFPGIGRKTAQRIAFYLINQPEDYVASLSASLLNLKHSLHFCQNCFNLCDRDVCDICMNTRRETSLLCVVEDSPGLEQIERSGSYHGYYHVLQGVLSPIHGVGPVDIRVRELLDRLKDSSVHEVILATNPTVEGEATALYLADLLEGSSLKVTRIASGIPAGSSLDFIDDLTMKKAMENRRTL